MTKDSTVQNKVESHASEVVSKCGETQWWVTMLYGSQNYGLSTPDSDVDTKTMIIPRFSDVVLGRQMVSTDLQMEDGSLSNVKDFRAMFHNYLKGNINFVETLYTDYYTVNYKYEKYFKRLRQERDIIANAQPRKLVHMAAGMARQKYVALEKPFESKKEILAKFGYDPKQLHHLLRLKNFIQNYMGYRDFYSAMVSDSGNQFLLDVKAGMLSLNDARSMAREAMAAIEARCDHANDVLPETTWKFGEAQLFLEDLTLEMFEDMWKNNRSR